MKDKKCLDCIQYRNCKDSFSSWLFFVVGLIATVAIRIVTVLMNINPIYGKIAWYIGIIGFLAFFIYKFNVSRQLAKTIQETSLIEKIEEQKNLSRDDYSLISSILCGLKSEKERMNYLFIFLASAIALLFAIYFDFLK